MTRIIDKASIRIHLTHVAVLDDYKPKNEHWEEPKASNNTLLSRTARNTGKPKKKQSEAPKAEHEADAALEPCKRRGKPSISTVVKNQNMRRRVSDKNVENSTELLNFQCYFHRRPLRVQGAFKSLRAVHDKEVGLTEFSKFVKDSPVPLLGS